MIFNINSTRGHTGSLLVYIYTRHATITAASRSRLLETGPKLFVFETSYYAFCGQYDIALNLSFRKLSKREYN